MYDVQQINPWKADSNSPYRRLAAAVVAFVVLGLFVKLAELLLTEEHRFHLPPPQGSLQSRAVQAWMWLRFSWQEFAIGAVFLTIVLGLQRVAPAPGRVGRLLLRLASWVLGLFAILGVLGIAYYDVYQAPLTADDFEYFRWTPQLIASSSLFRLVWVRVGTVLAIVLLIGLPMAVRRLSWRLVPAGAATAVCFAIAAAVTWAAGRPNLAEALIEPNPTVWLLSGHRPHYYGIAPEEQITFVGPVTRKFTPQGRPKNIVLIVLESTPAGSMYPFDPNAKGGRRLFDEFGEDITLFDNVFAMVPNSGSSFFSVMMGRSPFPTLDAATVAAGTLPSLTEILKVQGYRTGIFLNGDSNISMSGLWSRGFDVSMDSNKDWPGQERYAKLRWGRDERLLFDEARKYLEAQSASGPPFFLLLYTSNPHAPYSIEMIPGLGSAPDPKVRHRRMVEYELDLTADLYAWLKSSGRAADTMVLAYGDHGEAFNEHPNNIIHSKALFAENVHVPMLLMYPGRFGLPARISQLGSLKDVLPTLADLLGLSVEGRTGISLFSDAPQREVFSLTDYGPGMLALRDARFTYLLSRNGRELLFDRTKDPGETANVVAEYPEVAAKFRAKLK